MVIIQSPCRQNHAFFPGARYTALHKATRGRVQRIKDAYIKTVQKLFEIEHFKFKATPTSL